jgi:hypothetical protein
MKGNDVWCFFVFREKQLGFITIVFLKIFFCSLLFLNISGVQWGLCVARGFFSGL